MDAIPGPFTGWYNEVCNELKTSGALSKLQSEFSVCDSDFERIRVVSSVEFIVSGKVRDNYGRKSKSLSEDLRRQGNKLYAKNDCKKAIHAYNKSIAAAEARSPELYLALANRSAVNFWLGQYELSLLDIDKVLISDNYPKKLLYKIYERKGKCLMNLGKIDDARISFNEALRHVEYSLLEEAVQMKAISTIKAELSKFDVKDNTIPYWNKTAEHKIPPMINEKDRHDYILCSSKALSVVSNPEEGRHAVAARDISAGEIILVEEPFSYVPVVEGYETNCFNCLDHLRLAYPCRQCSTVFYCCEQCEETCWTSYHQYECKHLNILSAGDIGLAFLAFRMIVKEGTERLQGFKERLSHLDDVSVSMGVNEEGKYDSQDYLCCYQLMGHSDNRVLSDLFRRSLIAVYLAKIYLQIVEQLHGSFPKELIITIGGHLLKQIQMLPCNAHEISELEVDGQEVSNSLTKEIGSAIYATLSLLNHSCDPSVVRHAYGSTCALRSIKHIKEGEAIIDNYGFLYAVEEKSARVKHLQEQYFFTCQCVACAKDWLLYSDIPKEALPVFKKCKDNLELQSELTEDFKGRRESYQDSMSELLDGADPIQCLPVLLSFLDWITVNIEAPFIDINNCQEMVKQCFGMMSNSYLKN